jgi:hypothetical protein
MSRVIEEVALDFAKGRAQRMREEPFELFGAQVRLSPWGDGEGERYAAHHFAAGLARGWIDPTQAEQEARGGDPLFCGALMMLAGAELRGELILAEPLRSAVVAILTAPPKLRAGWKRETNFFRDIAIVTLVQEVCEGFALKPTGEGRARQSGCAIVGRALGMNYETVRAVWKRLGKKI